MLRFSLTAEAFLLLILGVFVGLSAWIITDCFLLIASITDDWLLSDR